jgi:hypothetical protein
MQLLSKSNIAIVAGAALGTQIYIPALRMAGIPIANGFGVDDIAIGLVFAASITVALMVAHSF